MPLRWKLVLIYALVLALVIGGFSVASVLALNSNLERGAAAEVEARARGLGAVVEFEGGAWVIEPKTGIDPQYTEDSGRYYRIARGGQVLLASPLARQFAPSPTPGERIWRRGDRRYVEVTLSIDKRGDEDEPAPPTTLQVTSGMDLREVDRAVASLTRLLSWLGPLVLLLSLGGGLLLAGRALAPIDEIARTAASITAEDLGRRIAVRGRDELAALAATLNATFERLQQAFAREQRFTADASHELRTPLAVVLGNLELALDRPRDAGELRELLGEAAAAAQQVQGLIDGLLLLARTDDGGLGRQVVALAPLCREVVRDEGAAAADSGVEVRSVAVADVSVRGDPGCLRQLLHNLIRNGVRYNRAGGRVTVSLYAADGAARLLVEDDGIGIPASALPRLGERFFRVDASRTRASGGVGLGLSIVAAIVRAHGGSLQFHSVEGDGTRVEVTLPLA